MILYKLWIIYLFFWKPYVKSISLNENWKGHVLLSEIDPFSTSVPCGIYTDLERIRALPKNLVGFNDVKNRWVENYNVAYTHQFEANSSYFDSSYIILTFHGLDTFSKIYVNNVQIGETSNMFLRYSYDIKNHLKEGINELKIIFESSVEVAKKIYLNQSASYIVPPQCVPKDYNGECHVNHIRKMQASYGWDWGPAFPSMGIWKDVEINLIKNAIVTDITVDIIKKKNSWQISVVTFFESFGKKNEKIDLLTHINCSIDEQSIKNSTSTNLMITNNKANATVILNVPNDKVQKWWPNGYGKQKLYYLKIKVETGTDVFEKKIKIGYRTIELIQDPLEKGLSFYFKVNGIPIFAKGSNWIPSNVFPEKLSIKKTVQYLLKSAKDTNMNMLRVWGGGVYESDIFYDLADEYGIMIWQDFMFACSMYPTKSSFLENVKEEVIQNMRRLKNHPSIALWAGNNENEAALYGNWYGTGTEKLYKVDYVKLYVDTIKDTAIQVDYTRPFVVSSPSNGLYSEEKNYTESNPYSNFYGDVHYYNYLKNGWDISQYPVTRFASEYGFQSLPSIQTLMTSIENHDDLEINSLFMKHRQHLPGGNAFMTLLISRNFIVPKNNNSKEELMNYIYLSQVTQAVSMRIQTELYRQMKSSFNDLGEGNTMGALYWQLNDVWQAPSWSSIDFEGRWKMLHYYAKEFFSPVIITSQLTKANELLVYVVSDLLQNLKNVTAEIIVYHWDNGKSIYTKQLENSYIEPNESKLLVQYWLDKFLEQAGCGDITVAKKNCFIELALKNSRGENIAPLNYVYPYSLKNLSLSTNNIGVKVQSNDIGNKSLSFCLELTSNKLSMFVWLELANITGQFSENGFHILKNKKNITFQSLQSVTAKEVLGNLTITSLS